MRPRAHRFSSRFSTFARAIVIASTSGVIPIVAARAQRVLTVIATDTGLVVSPTVPAGMVNVRLLIQGKTRRDLVVHRIPSGTAPAVLAKGAAGRPERWFEQWSFGGPGAPRDSMPDATTTLDLRPGRYALVSYEVDANGRPRGDKYMWSWVSAIRTSTLIPGRFSVPDATFKLRDARIDVTGTLRTGQRTLQVENAGAHPHELQVLRLKPGKTVDDLRRWDRRGDAPFVYVVSVTPMSTGMVSQIRTVFQSGTHVVVCGMPHGGAKDTGFTNSLMASFKVS